jgi:hypothetical protein
VYDSKFHLKNRRSDCLAIYRYQKKGQGIVETGGENKGLIRYKNRARLKVYPKAAPKVRLDSYPRARGYDIVHSGN